MIAASCGLFAGVPIEIDEKEFKKFTQELEKTLHSIPVEWESLEISKGKFLFPSGMRADVAEIEKLSQQNYDSLLNEMSSKNIVIKVLCEPRKNFKIQIQNHACAKKEEFNSEFLNQNINAQYVSQFSTLNKSNKPELLLRADSPFYSILHEYLHFLQETKSPTIIKNYSMKSLRVAMADSLFEKPDNKQSDQEKLIYKELELIQPLLDEVESYGMMLKFYKNFHLDFSDAHEIFWKLSGYFIKCGNKKCREELDKANAFYLKAQQEEIKKYSSQHNFLIPDSLLKEQVEKMKSADSYDGWYKNLKEEIYKINKLNEEHKVNVQLLADLNDNKVPYKDKKSSFEKLFRWMSLNSHLQAQIMKKIIDGFNKDLKYEKEIQNDKKFFESFL
jgi:hypothetical protein